MVKMQLSIEQKVPPKILVNVGALFDIPNCSFVIGKKGETIINGGLGYITLIAGPTSNYKSTIMHYLMLQASNRMGGKDIGMYTYDTECNISIDRLEFMASKFPNIPENPVTMDDPVWGITDKSTVAADKWLNILNDYVEAKNKEKKMYTTYEGFLNPYTKKDMELPKPSFVEIDSLSEFEAQSTVEMLSENIDSSDTNTYALKQSLFKTKMISTIPSLATRGNVYFLFAAHIGEKPNLATGPAAYNQPMRKFQHIKGADVIKGISNKANYLLTGVWMAHTASMLSNKDKTAPEYPLNENDKQVTDLNIVRLTSAKSKAGPGGLSISLIVSQKNGIIPELSEFHFIKESDRFGIAGNNIHYNLVLRPDVKLTRTTVRSKLVEDKLLRRAVNITAELLQLKIYHSSLVDQGLWCTPEQLYEDIKALGYEWDILLDTREYWTIDQYTNPMPFLSVVDLLNIRLGKYHPYFLDKDKKLKKEYIRK